ncbi:MAG: hypothetical protein ACJ8EE_03875 [Bradyrhizobium sp.]
MTNIQQICTFPQQEQLDGSALLIVLFRYDTCCIGDRISLLSLAGAVPKGRKTAKSFNFGQFWCPFSLTPGDQRL